MGNFKHDDLKREFYIYSEDQLKTGPSEFKCCFNTLPYLQKIQKIQSESGLSKFTKKRNRRGWDNKGCHFNKERLHELAERLKKLNKGFKEFDEKGDEIVEETCNDSEETSEKN